MATNEKPPKSTGRPLGATGEAVRKNIRDIRDRKGMSAPELSVRLKKLNRGIPPLGIHRIEVGDRRVDVDDLVAFAVALDVSPVTLLMPADVDVTDPVQVTGLLEPAAAIGVWEWLRGRLARPGLTRISVDTWPRWEQEEVLGQFSAEGTLSAKVQIGGEGAVKDGDD
jgi:transcriptional regulator with XRE-family HTH domain